MKINRWASLAAGFVVLLFSGIIYAWSILKAPFLSEFGWDQGALGVNFTVTMCCFVAGGIVGGAALKRIPVRVLMWVCAVVVFAGFFLTSRLTGESVGPLYVTYGVLCGLGIGAVYNAVISTVSGLFPDKSTTASGVMMMGFGASTLILGSICGILLQRIEWRSVYVLLAVLAAVILVVGSVFIGGRTPAAAAPTEDGSENAGDAANRPAVPEEPSVPDVSTKEMLRRDTFWKIYILFIMGTAIGNCVISIAKDVSMAVGNPETLAIVLVGVFSICNGAARIVCGLCFDRIGRRATIQLQVILAVSGTAVLLLSVIAQQPVLNTVGLVVAGFSFGFVPPGAAGYAKSMYGKKHFPLNFSLINSHIVISSCFATVSGRLIDASGSFLGVFVMLLVFGLVEIGMFLSLRKQI